MLRAAGPGTDPAAGRLPAAPARRPRRRDPAGGRADRRGRAARAAGRAGRRQPATAPAAGLGRYPAVGPVDVTAELVEDIGYGAAVTAPEPTAVGSDSSSGFTVR